MIWKLHIMTCPFRHILKFSFVECVVCQCLFWLLKIIRGVCVPRSCTLNIVASFTILIANTLSPLSKHQTAHTLYKHVWNGRLCQRLSSSTSEWVVYVYSNAWLIHNTNGVKWVSSGVKTTFVECYIHTWSIECKTDPSINFNALEKTDSPKTENCHNANFVATGGTAGCRYSDNLRCAKWRRSCRALMTYSRFSQVLIATIWGPATIKLALRDSRFSV